MAQLGRRWVVAYLLRAEPQAQVAYLRFRRLPTVEPILDPKARRYSMTTTVCILYGEIRTHIGESMEGWVTELALAVATQYSN